MLSFNRAPRVAFEACSNQRPGPCRQATRQGRLRQQCIPALPLPANGRTSPTPAEQAAALQARLFEQRLREHRLLVRGLTSQRPGLCMADGWEMSRETIDGDFDLDDSVLGRLMQVQVGPEGAARGGPAVRAAPPSAPTRAAPSVLRRKCPVLFVGPATSWPTAAPHWRDRCSSWASARGGRPWQKGCKPSWSGGPRSFGGSDAAERAAREALAR
jgi:hypothetical protein